MANWERRRANRQMREAALALRSYGPDKRQEHCYSSTKSHQTPADEQVALRRQRCGRGKVTVTLPTIRGLETE